MCSALTPRREQGWTWGSWVAKACHAPPRPCAPGTAGAANSTHRGWQHQEIGTEPLPQCHPPRPYPQPLWGSSAPPGPLPPHAAPMWLARCGLVLPVPPTYPHLLADSPVPAMQMEDCPRAGHGSSAWCHHQVWDSGSACRAHWGPRAPLTFAEQQGGPWPWPISPNTPVSVSVVWTGLCELLQKASRLWGNPCAFMGTAACAGLVLWELLLGSDTVPCCAGTCGWRRLIAIS